MHCFSMIRHKKHRHRKYRDKSYKNEGRWALQD